MNNALTESEHYIKYIFVHLHFMAYKLAKIGRLLNTHENLLYGENRLIII